MDLSKSYEFFQPEKHSDRIHIIGCGSVGSTVADMLARSGVTRFALWDFDKVEPHNIANQMFRQKDVRRPKVEALLDILCEVNPDIADAAKLYPEGWDGQQLSGYVFLCVDNIDVRRQIVQQHFDSPYVKAMFDFRTRLEDAQHYAADWSDYRAKKDFLNSMNFTHEEAAADTPVSACNIPLSVNPTVRVICARGVANFMNFWNGGPIKKLILDDDFHFVCDAF